MKIELSGYNVDSSLIEGAKLLSGSLSDERWTPETLSAAYARISRSEKDISTLRAESIQNVEKARKSNENIVFGYAHYSIAEHVILNFDISDISRLASEYMQKHRLVSYTEKSQRYTASNGSYVFPEEFSQNIKVRNLARSLIIDQFSAYHMIYDRLLSYFNSIIQDKRMAEISAKEDARYILPLCATSQFGMTINARNLEHMILNLYSSNVIELHNIANTLLSISKRTIPSLIKYIDPTNYIKNSASNIKSYLKDKIEFIPKSKIKDVYLVENPNSKHYYDLLIGSILYKLGYGSMESCLHMAQFNLTDLQQEQVLITAKSDMNVYDSLMREYEMVDFVFDLVMSAACYGQLKRHRMTTQIIGNYDPYLGVTVPESIQNSCFEIFNETIKKTNKIYLEIKEELGDEIASYILTNSHRRRILLKTNMREMFHIAKLRTKKDAQWDIRNLTNKMLKEMENKTQFRI